MCVRGNLPRLDTTWYPSSTVDFGPVGILRDPHCVHLIPLCALFESSPTSRMCAELGTTHPYHLDLRWRIVDQKINHSKPWLSVGQGTARGIVLRFVATGNVNPSTKGESCFRKLSKINELFAIGFVLKIQICTWEK